VKAEASVTAIVAARLRAGHLLFDGDPKVFRDDFALEFSGSDGDASLREDTNTWLAEFAPKSDPMSRKDFFSPPAPSW
jgi:hypothetical protein